MDKLKEEILELYSEAYPLMADCVYSCDDIIENEGTSSEEKVMQILEQINLMRKKYKNFCIENQLFGMRSNQEE